MFRADCRPCLGPLLALLLVVGCGRASTPELPGQEIDCAWFADQENCWRTSLATFAAQLPAPDQTGQLASDGKRCVYPSGHEIVFVNPIEPGRLSETNYLNGFAWDFEVRLQGDWLLSYREPNQSALVLQTARGVFRLEADPPAVVLTCPDGDQFHVPVAGLLVACPIENLPARTTSWDAAGVLFGLRGTSSVNRLVFHCLAP